MSRLQFSNKLTWIGIGFIIGHLLTASAGYFVFKKQDHVPRTLVVGIWKQHINDAYQKEEPETVLWALNSGVALFEEIEADVSDCEYEENIVSSYGRMAIVSRARKNDDVAYRKYLNQAIERSGRSCVPRLESEESVLTWLKSKGYSTSW